MKPNKTVLITILALFYLITITKTLLLYYVQIYFPDLDYIVSINIISQEFITYTWIIKLIMVLIALSLIPGFITTKNNFKKQYYPPERIPIHIIILFSALCPMLALVNNFITTNFLFSMALLIYGAIFTVLAYKYR